MRECQGICTWCRNITGGVMLQVFLRDPHAPAEGGARDALVDNIESVMVDQHTLAFERVD